MINQCIEGHSKTCLEGTPQYPRENVFTRNVSLHHRFLNVGKIRYDILITGRPLIIVLEYSFYCTAKFHPWI